MRERIHNQNKYSQYDIFFIAGSFLMVPELTKRFTLTTSFVNLGLRLDDCWDFGIDRRKNHGKFIDPSNFGLSVNPQFYNRYQKARDQLRKVLDFFPKNLKTTFERFEQGIMITEALALAIGDHKNCPIELLEIYRVTDAMVWGAMYMALKPNSSLVLPDLKPFIEDWGQNPTIGLSDLYHHYARHLLLSGPEGLEALSLTYQMMCVQRTMDKIDQPINNSLSSPSIARVNKERTKYYLELSDSYRQFFSITRHVAWAFPAIYRLLTSFRQWRNDVEGWTPPKKTSSSVTFSQP